jgi:putative transposase
VGDHHTSPEHHLLHLPAFPPGRHRLSAEEYRCEMTDRFTTWIEVTGTTTAA